MRFKVRDVVFYESDFDFIFQKIRDSRFIVPYHEFTSIRCMIRAIIKPRHV